MEITNMLKGLINSIRKSIFKENMIVTGITITTFATIFYILN